MIIPDSARHVSRQTLAVFIHPDADTLVACLDGSDDEPPILAGADAKKRLQDDVILIK